MQKPRWRVNGPADARGQGPDRHGAAYPLGGLASDSRPLTFGLSSARVWAPKKSPDTASTARGMAERSFRVSKVTNARSPSNLPPNETAAGLAERRLRAVKMWQGFVFSTDAADSEATNNAHWQACAVCGEHWTPHARRTDEDNAIRNLCGFDIVGGMNRLIVRRHEVHGTAEAKACNDAYAYLYSNLRTLAPERLSEMSLVETLQPLSAALTAFRAAAGAAKKSCGWRDQWAAVERACGLAQSLAGELESVDRDWAFASTGRSLPGTRKGKGRPNKQLLAEAEAYLRRGAVSQTDIAKMDLDGGLETTAAILGPVDTRAGVVETEPIGPKQKEQWRVAIKAAERRVRGRAAELRKVRSALDDLLV